MEARGYFGAFCLSGSNNCELYYEPLFDRDKNNNSIVSSNNKNNWFCSWDINAYITLITEDYNYTTTITDEKGVIQRYTFNQLGQNTNIWINDGDGESKETTIEYLYDNAPTNLPTKITYREYSGTKGYDRYTEEISYTDNFDVREDKIGRLSDEFSDVYYEYDYDLNDTGYGIPLVTTTKMDKNTDIVQESLLGLSDRAIRQTVVRRGEKRRVVLLISIIQMMEESLVVREWLITQNIYKPSIHMVEIILSLQK